MRETGFLLTHPGLQETSQVWKYFLYYMTKKCIRSKNQLKADQKQSFIISLHSRGQFYSCTFLNVLYSNIFIQYWSSSEPPRLYEIFIPFLAHLWFTTCSHDQMLVTPHAPAIKCSLHHTLPRSNARYTTRSRNQMLVTPHAPAIKCSLTKHFETDKQILR